MDPDKVERIVSWPTPKTGSELSSFLGLASYYRRFVPGFAKIATSLHSLTKSKGAKAGKTSTQPLEWSGEADRAFTTLKNLLATTPVLAYPRFGEEFVVEVDASLKGLGACLLQKDTEGKLHPVAYASRGLRGAEKNYSDFSSFKIELLALKWAVVEKFRDYLLGVKCTVYSDNNPLSHLKTANLGATEQRWAAQLAPFDLTILYKPGKENKCADALSRCPSNDTGNIQASIREFSTCAILPAEIVSRTGATTAPNTSPCVFPSYTLDQLATIQKADESLRVVWECWTSGWTTGDKINPCTSEIKAWLREFDKLTTHQGVLYRHVSNIHRCKQTTVSTQGSQATAVGACT